MIKKNLSINVSLINSQGIHVTFGGENNCTSKMLHFENILTEWTEEFLKEVSLITEEEQTSKIRGTLKISREQGSLYRVNGEIYFEPLLECIRSLTLFRENLRADIHGFFVPENSQKYQKSGMAKLSHKKEEEIELSEIDLESYPFKGNEIQLDELLLDAMYCALPELPLCRNDCKGLCSECGAELNEKDRDGNLKFVVHNKKCSYFKHPKSN